jgi:drug/metabolite transporter (DMT)-like permease
MDAWIPITLTAAFFQTLRFAFQKRLKGQGFTSTGSTLARFIYSSPLVIVGALTYAKLSGQELPATNLRFWAFALSGGLGQILATICVVALFSYRNFAVGITFKKTDVLMTAIVGMLVLQEGLSQSGWAAVLIGFLAVLILSDPPKSETFRWTRIFNKAAGIGLLSGVLFAVSAVGYRGASLALSSGDVALRAAVTLAIVTAAQSIAMLGWMAWQDRAQIMVVLRGYRVAIPVGLTSMIGSFCWFAAFTLQNAAVVNALGQVELLFSLAVSTLLFKERPNRRELAGIALLGVSILILVLLR